MPLTDAIIHALINGRPHPTSLIASNDHLRHLKSREIAQTQLHKLALLVQLIQLLERVGEGDRSIGRMQVEDIHTIRLQFRQRLVQHFPDDFGFVQAGLVGIPFGGEGQAALFPVGVRTPGFLLSTDVDAGGVDFVVALLLEVVEALVELVEAGDTGAFVDVGAEGHEPQDNLEGVLARILR